MNIVDNIISYLKKEKNNQDKAPKGICPNCWGRQEYGGQFYKAIKNYGLDINHPDNERGWIQDYADKYLKDISLVEHNDYNTCSKCKLRYVEEN